MSVSKLAETVVDEKVQNGEMFTAHDVTLEVRSRGHKVNHEEIRDAVHDYHSRGGMGVAYIRTVIQTPKGNPWLYHRSVDDPNSYGNIRTSNQQVTIPTHNNNGSDNNTVISAPVNVLSSVAALFGKKPTPRQNASTLSARKTDARKTLSIPSPLVRGANFKIAQQVYAVASSDGLDIVAQAPPSGAVYSSYTVDRNSQVRITQATLRRAGIAGTEFDVEGDSSSVKVKLHK